MVYGAVKMFYYFMFVYMKNINIIKKEWVKTIRKLYSAVNELLDILGRDVSEWGYDKEKLERKVQAYVNYLGDTKEWEELTKRKDSNEDKDLLLDKVQDDVLDIMSLSTSREDADKARKALRQLSNVTSADVMDVLNSCIDDGWRVGKSTRYAKKKLVMNSVPSIYEKEETNNWADLYYNVVHWRYQILNWDKIYTTKRGGLPKAQEVDPQENWEEKVWVSVTGEIGEDIGEIPVVSETVEVADQKEVAEEAVEKREESEGQHERVDTIENQPKEENKQIEEEVEWSEKKVIEELMKIQNVEWFEELQRCNDVEFSFLAQQLLKFPETIDLLKKIPGDKEWNMEEFKSIIDKLLAKFTVNEERFDEWAKILGVKDRDGNIKSFESVKLDLSRQLWIDKEAIDSFKNISEYITFISCLNNIKNSVMGVVKMITWKGKNSLTHLLNWENEVEVILKVKKYFIDSLCEKIWEMKNKSELGFDSLLKVGEKGYSLSKSVEVEIAHLVKHRNNQEEKEKSVECLICLFLPVFIKKWIFESKNDIFAHHWLNYVDISGLANESYNVWWKVVDPNIKYKINWKIIELWISKLKNFAYKSDLKNNYYDFKHIVLYSIYETIKGKSDCPYWVNIWPKVDKKDMPSIEVFDVCAMGGQFYEDSHFGECLEKFFENNWAFNKIGGVQSDSWDVGDSTTAQERIEGDVCEKLADIQTGREEIMEATEASLVSGTETIEERIIEGEWENDIVEVIGQNEEKQKSKNKKNKRQNNVSEWNDNVKNVTIEDIISFYANNDERAKLKTLKKKGGSDQRDCSKLREDYKIRIVKPGFKKWILIGLKTIADKIGEKTGNKINKPYTHKWFDTIVWELARLGWKS